METTTIHQNQTHNPERPPKDHTEEEAIAYLADLERRLAQRRGGWRLKRGGQNADHTR